MRLLVDLEHSVDHRIHPKPSTRFRHPLDRHPTSEPRVVRESGIGPDDVVVEVGPGLGSLTLALLEVARRVVAIEVDPLLAGRLAAAFVRGAQAEGVATTVKHLVGNDAEHERYTISSDIDERALREIYLRPFEIAVREATKALLSGDVHTAAVADLQTVAEALGTDKAIKGLVITSTSDVNFCAGADVEEMAGAAQEEPGA